MRRVAAMVLQHPCRNVGGNRATTFTRRGRAVQDQRGAIAPTLFSVMFFGAIFATMYRFA
jgi:hypothetical protein